MTEINDLKAIVLAAGKGVRMKSDLPKVLHPLLGKPLILHVLDNIKKSNATDVTVVIGYEGEQVKERVGDDVNFVWQREQLGTGHAVLQAEEHLKDFKGKVIVACGDAPLISETSFKDLVKEMDNGEVKAAVLTMVHEDPTGYGRMVKDSEGSLIKIVEEKDANSDEKKITEVNSGTYVFDSELLFEGLKQIGNDNAQGEYYLPDVLTYIISKGHRVTTMPLANPFEGSGINSKEELEEIERKLKENK